MIPGNSNPRLSEKHLAGACQSNFISPQAPGTRILALLFAVNPLFGHFFEKNLFFPGTGKKIVRLSVYDDQ